MHRSFIAVAATVAALTLASVASADVFIVPGSVTHHGKPPAGVMLTGGDSGACQTVGDRRSDGFSGSDTAVAYYSYCYGGGQTWAGNGWDGASTCQLLCQFAGFDNNYTFGNGRHTRANWNVFALSYFLGVSWHTSATACVAVDGWGNAWQC